jgi:hypothetical protein
MGRAKINNGIVRHTDQLGQAKFVDASGNIVNRDEIGKRLAGAVKGLTFMQ